MVMQKEADGLDCFGAGLICWELQHHDSSRLGKVGCWNPDRRQGSRRQCPQPMGKVTP